MRKIVSPLSGIRSPFNLSRRIRSSSVSPLAIYAVLGIEPQLVLDFDDEAYFANSVQTAFDSTITHTRAGNATMVDSNGLLKWAPHNLLTYSEQFDNAAWAKVGSGTGSAPVVTADAAIAPDGNLAADRIQFDQGAGTSSSDFSLVSSSIVSTEALYTRGIWLKSNTSENYIIIAYGSGNNTGIEWTVTPEWQLFKLGTNSDYSTSSQDKVGIGNLVFGLRGGAGAQYFMGTNTPQSADILAWGAHLYRSDLGGMVNNPDQSTGFETYVPTTTTARHLPRRGHHVFNGSEWVNNGLLVENKLLPDGITRSRTNYFDGSTTIATSWQNFANASLVGNSAISPDGNLNAVLVQGSSVGGSGVVAVDDVVQVTADTNNTYSVFVKAAGKTWCALYGGNFTASPGLTYFDLENGVFGTVGANVTATHKEFFGNGWWRISITFNPGADNIGNLRLLVASGNGALSVPLDGTSTVLMYGPQCEAGSTPSSYIPTYGSIATRAADVLTIPAASISWPEPVSITGNLYDGADPVNITGSYLFTPIIPDDGTTKVIRVKWTQNFNVGTRTRMSFRNAADSADVGPLLYYTGNGTFEKIIATNSGLKWLQIEPLDVDISDITLEQINPIAVSIQMQGEMNYADTENSSEAVFSRWFNSSVVNIQNYLRTDGAYVGSVTFTQYGGGSLDAVATQFSVLSLSPGINVPYNIASRHGSTFINGAVDGTALTADTTPVELPNLSATDLQIAYDYMGTISKFRMWPDDLGDTGITEAST